MNIIFKIARTELRNLFYSPIAWFLIIVFLIQCGMVYIKAVDANVRSMEVGGMGLEYMTDLTNRIFTGRGGLFSSVMQNLYLYIPLLTMGLISREINGGTIKLLYSSPIKVKHIVFGKYLAMMIYSLILVAIIGIFMISGLFQIKSPNVGVLLSSALGFYLLLCTYSAIGLFMSALTTYQVVAALSTFIMIGILSYIGTVWQEYDFFRDLTYFLSLNGRTGHTQIGLITTKDVIYFFVITYVFLGITIYKLKAERESKSFLVIAGKYAFIIVSALLIGYLSSRPFAVGYLDNTVNKTNTLTPKTQQIVKDLGTAPLEITLYSNLLDGNNVYIGLPKMRNEYLQLWEPYLRFKPDIQFHYVNYYDKPYAAPFFEQERAGRSLKQMAVVNAKNYDVAIKDYKTPEEIKKIIDLKPELNRLVMQLKYKGRTTFLRIFEDNSVYPSETEIAAAFKRLLAADLPKIAFLNGNHERSVVNVAERDYIAATNATTFRLALINQGFDIETLSPERADIPGDITTLVIADPMTAYSPAVLAKIQRYIAAGRNVLIAGEMGKNAIIDPVLKPLGVKLLDGTILHKHKFLAPDLITGNLTATAAALTTNMGKSYADHLPVTMPGVTGLSYQQNAGFTVKPLVMTDPETSWMEKGKISADTAAVSFSAAEGDERKAFPVVIALTRKINGKEQRIVVTGDADFMSNVELGRSNVKAANFFFTTALYSWLSNGEFPIDTTRPDALDNRMTIGSDSLQVFKIAVIWVLPILIGICGAILLIRRKRK